MNPHGPEILALLLAAGAFLPWLFTNIGIGDAGGPDRGVLRDEAFLLASMLWT